MSSRLWFALAVVACLVIVAFGQKSVPNRDNLPAQRYQLTTAHLEREGDVIFMLDTKEGRVWQYQSAVKTGEVTFADNFLPIGIGIRNLESLDLKRSAAEDARTK